MGKAPAGARTLVIGFSAKMYFTRLQTLRWCKRAGEIASANPAVAVGAIEVFILPSFPYLAEVIEILAGGPVAVGAQDMHWEREGPFTGEVSPSQLAELGCRYVEVGHSERRRLFGETDATVALKVEAALRNGLRPVICVGESEDSGAAAAIEVAVPQLKSALARVERHRETPPVVVAYEPRWAIGTGQTASARHIVTVCGALKSALPLAGSVIYGGSAGRGLLASLGAEVDGLFLGTQAHDPEVLQDVLQEAASLVDLHRGA